MPGVNGIPLNYVICEEENPQPEDSNLSFLENYAQMVLTGDAYQSDNTEVHTYIIHFIAGNSVAEAKIISHGEPNDGQSDYIALQEHYSGVGINALEITRAEFVITNLF